jgi:hypothetical protein
MANAPNQTSGRGKAGAFIHALGQRLLLAAPSIPRQHEKQPTENAGGSGDAENHTPKNRIMVMHKCS